MSWAPTSHRIPRLWQIGKSSIFSLRMMEDWSICQRRGILCEVGAHPAILSAHQIVWYSCQLIDSRAPAQVCERWLPSFIWWVWLHGTHGVERIEVSLWVTSECTDTLGVPSFYWHVICDFLSLYVLCWPWSLCHIGCTCWLVAIPTCKLTPVK